MRNCIVLGVARSGTSALAGSLHAAGYYCGDDLLGPNEMNPKGYFESLMVNTINSRAVVATQYAYDPDNERPDWMAVFPREPLRFEGFDRDLATAAIARGSPFCYKDPRLAFTFPLWRPLLPADTTVVVVYRWPREQVASLQRGIKMLWSWERKTSEDELLKHWVSAYEHILRADNGRFVYLRFDDVMSGRFACKLSDALGTSLSSDFVDPRLVTTTVDGDLPNRCRWTWEELEHRRSLNTLLGRITGNPPHC